ncbi:MAG TPA: chorismate mutase [Candidatus Dormibacteraeota bacterium]|nr:chorismate mutase [Candidatus Dormibacteraeota bacterium]
MSDQDDRLNDLRKQIDTLDEELLRVLSERMNAAREIGSYKKSHGLDLTDSERMRAVLETQLSRADQAGLPHEFVQELYEVIYKHTIAVEADTP